MLCCQMVFYTILFCRMTETDAHVIVFGNEKGGSGKSTTAMHVAIALLRLGYRIGTVDLDARQATLTRYMRNRFNYARRHRASIPMPDHMAIVKSEAPTVEEQQREEYEFLMLALGELKVSCDFIIIDTPGSDSYMSRMAHGHADTLITPMNDSFIDLDLLADIDPEALSIIGSSVYSEMVAGQRKRKKEEEGKDIDWIVMRNRMTHIDANNKRIVSDLLDRAAEEFDFRLAPGFGERVVFRELFLKGLTLMDLKEDSEKPLTLSQLSARQEVRQLIRVIGPEQIKGYRKPPAEP